MWPQANYFCWQRSEFWVEKCVSALLLNNIPSSPSGVFQFEPPSSLFGFRVVELKPQRLSALLKRHLTILTELPVLVLLVEGLNVLDDVYSSDCQIHLYSYCFLSSKNCTLLFFLNSFQPKSYQIQKDPSFSFFLVTHACKSFLFTIEIARTWAMRGESLSDDSLDQQWQPYLWDTWTYSERHPSTSPLSCCRRRILTHCSKHSRISCVVSRYFPPAFVRRGFVIGLIINSRQATVLQTLPWMPDPG